MVKPSKKNICTKCGLKVFPQDIRSHPTLGVVICSACYDSYVEVGDISRYWRGVDLDGTDNYCRWCLDGGDLILCNDETCHSSFCKNCIERNFSKTRAIEIEKSSDWYCFVCDRTQLEHLRIKPTKKAPEKPSNKPNLVMTNVQKPNEKASVEKGPIVRPPVEKARVEKPPAEKPSLEKPSVERPQVEKQSVVRPLIEKPPVEKQQAEKTSAEKQQAEKTTAEKQPAEKTTAEKQPAEKTTAEKQPAEKTTSEKLPAEKTQVDNHPVEKTPIEETLKEKAPIPKALDRAAVRLTVRNPVTSTEKIIDVPINKEPERPVENAFEATVNGVSKPLESDQPQPPPTQGTKRKLGRHLGIFSTSRICSKPKSVVTPEVKKPIADKVNNERPVVEPVTDKPPESNGTVSDKTIDLAAIEKELDISDNDSDFMDASEVPPMPINDTPDVSETNPVWFPSTTTDIVTENNETSTRNEPEPDVVMIDVASKHDNPAVVSNQETNAQDSDIFEALEAHKSSIDCKVMEWALKDADILRDRLDIHIKALQAAFENYDRSKFIKNPKTLRSWASNLDSFMNESPAIRKRCYNLITHPNLNE